MTFHLPAERATNSAPVCARWRLLPKMVFYRLKDDRPEIVRVLDGRQDIEEIFSDGENG
jgi:hypothetical protein